MPAWIYATSLLLSLCAGAQAAAFDHTYATFSAVLQRHVREGNVDYAALKQNRGDLDRFLGAIGSVAESDYGSWSREQRLAFLLNAYNAAVLQLVVDNYPISSIKKIGGWFTNPFRIQFISLFGRKVSLDDIEHGRIRQDFNEPRIHFALVCAARSCPPLRAEPYLPDKLAAQLDDQARRFLNDGSKNRVALNANTVYLSAIFKWFQPDFGEGEAAVMAFAARYWPESIRHAVKERKIRVRYLDYDWRLNDHKP